MIRPHRTKAEGSGAGRLACLIALLHRLGMEHRKPKTVSRKLDPEKQAALVLSGLAPIAVFRKQCYVSAGAGVGK